MFAKNLVTAPFLGVFSYTTQVKVCTKFWSNFIFGRKFFSYTTQVKVCTKFWSNSIFSRKFFSYTTEVRICTKFWSSSIFGRKFFYTMQVKVCTHFGHKNHFHYWNAFNSWMTPVDQGASEGGPYFDLRFFYIVHEMTNLSLFLISFHFLRQIFSDFVNVSSLDTFW